MYVGGEKPSVAKICWLGLLSQRSFIHTHIHPVNEASQLVSQLVFDTLET